ncbi:autotransporter outer membrane beta-barrel domain-containing protein [Stenotrophomonas maltophilia]|uniref:autotransporter family protein n=1 Tax=Stenotrophomonas maltophilia TaxID=40324 RepID=UPI0028960932|nr:autotransporter outer membrane beta-barrel domain-containing protein [Stenotrophomonas maltophilia]MDT3500996.1 autotransporter outer membrane beta-barrel domain-containing protein [Stenotrophomonas maltophilia]
MKHPHRSAAGGRSLALRPLSQCLLLALALPLAQHALAGNLNDEDHDVVQGDPIEAWRVTNGSNLTVTDASTYGINATYGSNVVLMRADVLVRNEHENMHVQSGSSLTARNSRIDLGMTQFNIAVDSSARLYNTRIDSIGGAISLFPDFRGGQGDVYLLMDNSHLAVAHRDSTAWYHNVGLSMGAGRADIVNGSTVRAGRNGAVMYFDYRGADNLALNVDNSTLESLNGPAIWVNPDADVDGESAEINIRNGARLIAGDGTLLLVKHGEEGQVGNVAVRFNVENAALAGDIIADRESYSGQLDVSLRNRATLIGRIVDASSVAVGDQSTWQLTGDSSVGRLQLDAGSMVKLGDGAGGFNTLSLDEFIGNGGTLVFNTVLGEDDSQTDRLVIAGDATGQANVRVLNAGGQGAQTDKGIELIEINGASDAQFDLVGRAVGGQYEYFLFKDEADGNWYLRSELPVTPPDPCDLDPSLPGCDPNDPTDPSDPSDPSDPITPPVPVLRPETGAYLANQYAAGQLFRLQRSDRDGNAAVAGGVQGWARVDSQQARLGAMQEQLDLRTQRHVVQVGADVGLFDEGRGRLGVMLGSGRADSTSTSALTGFAARGKVAGVAAGVYGSWNNDRAYVDSWVQRGRFNNRVEGDGLAAERYDSDLWQGSLEAGYRFGIGTLGDSRVSLQPELQLVYTNVSTDRHTEQNGTVVRGLGESGLSGRLGLRLEAESTSTHGAVVTPYLTANWYRDARTGGMAFDDVAMDSDAPRNRYALGAGARVEFAKGWTGWGGLDVSRGDSGYREVSATLGMSYNW